MEDTLTFSYSNVSGRKLSAKTNDDKVFKFFCLKNNLANNYEQISLFDVLNIPIDQKNEFPNDKYEMLLKELHVKYYLKRWRETTAVVKYIYFLDNPNAELEDIYSDVSKMIDICPFTIKSNVNISVSDVNENAPAEILHSIFNVQKGIYPYDKITTKEFFIRVKWYLMK